MVAEKIKKIRDIRRGGSAAVDLCSVAAGRVDAYYERGVHAWDIAAGGLIAREAGATMGGLAGKPAGPDLTIAAGPGLFGELRDQLERLDPERDRIGTALPGAGAFAVRWPAQATAQPVQPRANRAADPARRGCSGL